MSDMPNGPWESVAVDFNGPIADSRHVLVAKDEYSRFPAEELVKSTSAQNTILKLKKIFSDFGNPQKVKSDNGPPFNGKTFQNKKGFTITASSLDTPSPTQQNVS